MLLTLPDRFLKDKVRILYESNNKCIIPTDKFTHLFETLPTKFSFQNLGIQCRSDSINFSILYEAIKFTKNIELSVERIIRNYIPPQQVFEGEFKKVKVSIFRDQEQEF